MNETKMNEATKDIWRSHINYEQCHDHLIITANCGCFQTNLLYVAYFKTTTKISHSLRIQISFCLATGLYSYR